VLDSRTTAALPTFPAAPGRSSALPAVSCAAVLAAVWIVLAPRTADLAAQVYRTHLFAREGFALWDNNWFGGHHLLGYSLLFPALAAMLSPAVVGVASVLASSALFAALVRDEGAGRRRAIAWFACAAAGDLFIGRLTFALGVSLAMACLLAAARDRPRVALAFGILAAIASPVSGLLLTLVLLAWLPPLARNWRVTVIAAPAGVASILSLSFPEGGVQPYPAAAALLALGITLTVATTLPRAMRAARRGTMLYAAAIVASYMVPSPMGSNIARLGVLAAGPVLVLGLCRTGSSRRHPPAVLLVAAVAAWQLWAPVTETLKATGNRATSASYFAPLTRELQALPAARVEVVPTSTRWESVYVAGKIPLARGWETQLDHRYNELFYRRTLPPAAYLRWLRHLAVSYVAVSDGPKERWGRLEDRLLRTPVTGLREVWNSRHWRLFAVSRAPALVSGGRLVSFEPQAVTVATPRPGSIVIRVRYTRFWQADGHACVTRTAAGFTRLQVPTAGTYNVRALWHIDSLLDRGPARCQVGR
jgi:hypothetical protein